MQFSETNINGCFLVTPEPLADERGWFSRVFCADEFKRHIGKDLQFVQINHSFNSKKGTFRGMHFQQVPYSEEKLIRCVAGSVMDFVLDLKRIPDLYALDGCRAQRQKPATHFFAKKARRMEFQTLEDNTELIYHHTTAYHREADRGILYNDPRVNIQLPMEISLISEKDKSYGVLDNNFNGIDI